MPKTETPAKPQTWDVFISHASEDKAYVDELHRTFVAAGVQVWLDKGTLRWGDRLRSRIDEAVIPDSDCAEEASTTDLPLHPRRKRFARASSLLSGSTNRGPLSRPWSVAEYTFGDTIRRHEAQYAARAAAALAVGIEPPPYEPYITGLIRTGTPEWEEEQQMQQHSSEYWAAHFRKQIADRPDIQQYLDEEEQQAREAAQNTDNCGRATDNFPADSD